MAAHAVHPGIRQYTQAVPFIRLYMQAVHSGSSIQAVNMGSTFRQCSWAIHTGSTFRQCTQAVHRGSAYRQYTEEVHRREQYTEEVHRGEYSTV